MSDAIRKKLAAHMRIKPMTTKASKSAKWPVRLTARDWEEIYTSVVFGCVNAPKASTPERLWRIRSKIGPWGEPAAANQWADEAVAGMATARSAETVEWPRREASDESRGMRCEKPKGHEGEHYLVTANEWRATFPDRAEGGVQ